MTQIPSYQNIEVFSFFSRDNKELHHTFEKYLRLLQLRRYITLWHSCSLEELDQFSDPVPNTLALVLLFLSDSREASLPTMKHIRTFHDAGMIRLFPVLSTPGEITATALESLMVFPTVGGPISTWYQQETAFYEIALDLAYQIDLMRGRVSVRGDGLASSRMNPHTFQEAPQEESAIRKELEEDEAYFGPDHPRIARDLELLAAIYRHRGQIEHAVRMTERRLSIQEAAYGPSHVYVVMALMELATLHESLRQFAQAETIYLRLLVLLEQQGGTLEGSGLVDLLIMMGDMYAQQRVTEKLFHAYERAASLLEQEYGPAHKDLVEVFGKMAIVAHAEGHPEQAQQYLRKSIDGYERVYGPEHLQVVEVLEQVAKIYQRLDQFEQAEALLQ